VVVRFTPEAKSVMTIVAWGINALLLSFTVPVSVAVLLCAPAVAIPQTKEERS
jgi:hypothetical protein